MVDDDLILKRGRNRLDLNLLGECDLVEQDVQRSAYIGRLVLEWVRFNIWHTDREFIRRHASKGQEHPPNLQSNPFRYGAAGTVQASHAVEQPLGVECHVVGASDAHNLVADGRESLKHFTLHSLNADVYSWPDSDLSQEALATPGEALPDESNPIVSLISLRENRTEIGRRFDEMQQGPSQSEAVIGTKQSCELHCLVLSKGTGDSL